MICYAPTPQFVCLCTHKCLHTISIDNVFACNGGDHLNNTSTYIPFERGKPQIYKDFHSDAKKKNLSPTKLITGDNCGDRGVYPAALRHSFFNTFFNKNEACAGALVRACVY